MPILYLIPTVLVENTVNQVLPPQVKEIIKDIDVYLVENIRTARRFISSLKTGRPIDELQFFLLNKETPELEMIKQLQKLSCDAGVLSDAGCPGVADPGAIAVRIAHRLGWRVVPLVGPSSILLALMASGMNGQSFTFHGYLPINQHERRRTLRELEKEAQKHQQTQLFIETPFRNNQLLNDILDTCQSNTQLGIACNLTAPDEFIRTCSVGEWKTQVPDLHKKPTIFLLL